jgi:hypothetical protein
MLSDPTYQSPTKEITIMNTFQLYLGRNIPTGGVVTDHQLAAFLRVDVTPRFLGFTVQNALGYWKGEPEDTVILTICCDECDQPKVAEVAQLYKELFRQESVGVLTLPAIEFI